MFQLWLIIRGESVLDESSAPSMAERIRRYFFYFTIQSNILVAWGVWMIVCRPDVDTRVFRVVRLASIVGIAVTGVVHWFFLRPLLDLEGGSFLVDKLLHVVVPLLAVIGWLVFGPRRRVGRDDVLPALAWAIGWLALTLIAGPIADFYPYPFVDVDDLGLGRVLVNCLGVAVLFCALCVGALWLDRRLPGAEQSDQEPEIPRALWCEG
jgi:hypothetical protein